MSARPDSQHRLRYLSIALCAAFGLCAPAYAGDLHEEALNGSVHAILGGEGGNVTYSVGADGVFIVDSGARADAPDIQDLVQEGGRPIRYVVNSHAHPAQTGGNERFAKTGAVIVAHEEVRDVLMANVRGRDEAALPIITLSELGRVSFDFNGEMIEVFHVAPAHSPGNLIVYFPASNVIHVGELFSPQAYPTLAGGTLEAWIGALNQAVRLADRPPARAWICRRSRLFSGRLVLRKISYRTYGMPFFYGGNDLPLSSIWPFRIGFTMRYMMYYFEAIQKSQNYE